MPTRRTLLATTLAIPLIRQARAETPRLRLAKQYGIGYAQMAILEEQKLIEKHAAAAGLGAIEVTWSTFRSSDVMNDALLSGNLDIASLGVPGLATIWDRTQATRSEVKGLVGLNIAPLSLVTREPGVRTLADFRPGMKIALPAVKVSNQAIFLQMAAATLWGPAEFARLDPLTISMSHPDAVIALLSGGEITSYFGSPPFTQRALKNPAIHEVTNSTAILGAPASFNVLAAPTRFYAEKPQARPSLHRGPCRSHRRHQRWLTSRRRHLRPRHQRQDPHPRPRRRHEPGHDLHPSPSKAPFPSPSSWPPPAPSATTPNPGPTTPSPPPKPSPAADPILLPNELRESVSKRAATSHMAWLSEHRSGATLRS